MRKLILNEREFKKLPQNKKELYSSFLCLETYPIVVYRMEKFRILDNGYPVPDVNGNFTPISNIDFYYDLIKNDEKYVTFYHNLIEFFNENRYFISDNELEALHMLLVWFKIDRHRDPLQYFLISDIKINTPCSLIIEVNFRRRYLLSFSDDGSYTIHKIIQNKEELT